MGLAKQDKAVLLSTQSWSLLIVPLSYAPNVEFTMSKASQPELKKVTLYSLLTAISFTLFLLQFMDKKLFVHLQGGRKVSGVLRGYDLFLNLVLDDCLEESTAAQKFPIGTVVSLQLSTKSDSSNCSRLYVATALHRWKHSRRSGHDRLL